MTYMTLNAFISFLIADVFPEGRWGSVYVFLNYCCKPGYRKVTDTR